MNAAFLARMEDILAVYARPVDARFPVVCFDERPCVLHGQPVAPLDPVPARPGRHRRESHTYVRQGTACLLAAFEPASGQRLVEVSARRTGADYCRFLQRLAAHYPHAQKIVLVQDNLNTHTDAVLYQHLPPAEARALAERFEWHYTPRNASWLNMVELELSAIACQCLHQRIPTLEELTAHVAACVAERNAARATVHWQFTLEDARQKLNRHYQKIRGCRQLA
ncbi:IS630 family transposase [Hymenobacter psychrotolerans]|uniref:DDE superfamily endonuclease n=1 Tax=Hymenobacter psychrotolerans DSM 18569 TaxID=1121959 RepID=A0A1M7D206_9BACT|nr:IS630 family transposase [Hymenobacter psychrotolerans]SHL73417.1 DDE superfamily endonuclease [Hymenobacter psychrotolerans DSM 18569]